MNAVLLCIHDESDCDLSRLWSLLSPWQLILHAYHHLPHSKREAPSRAIDTPGWDPPRLSNRDGFYCCMAHSWFKNKIHSLKKILCHCFFLNDLAITRLNKFSAWRSGSVDLEFMISHISRGKWLLLPGNHTFEGSDFLTALLNKSSVL
jgi:hypothetical protein